MVWLILSIVVWGAVHSWMASLKFKEFIHRIAAWMQDKDYAFMAAPNASAAAAFGNVASVPTSFIVDAEGHIRHKIAGQVHYPRLEKLVVPLLAEARQP